MKKPKSDAGQWAERRVSQLVARLLRLIRNGVAL